MVYGTQACPICFGYGIELQLHEAVEIKNAIRKGLEPITIQRKDNYPRMERCFKCKGMGWIFVPNCPHIILPYRTIER